MAITLVDSNVILDVITEDAQWSAWSADALARATDQGVVAINPLIYAEVSIGFDRIETLDEILPPAIFRCHGKLASWPASVSCVTAAEAAPGAPHSLIFILERTQPSAG